MAVHRANYYHFYCQVLFLMYDVLSSSLEQNANESPHIFTCEKRMIFCNNHLFRKANPTRSVFDCTSRPRNWIPESFWKVVSKTKAPLLLGTLLANQDHTFDFSVAGATGWKTIIVWAYVWGNAESRIN